MSTVPPVPSADSITVEQTLQLLEGRFSAFARGVADGRYVLWLGSGISRERLPDLGELIRRVLDFLQARITAGKPDCPHRLALEQALDLADLRPEELEQCGSDDRPATWPVIDQVVRGLWGRYSELLAIRVGGEAPDYLLWEAVDVRATYGPGIDPDCEHLCIGILVLEGVVTEAVSANWDGLIESALARLAGNIDGWVRVVVLPDELRDEARPLDLLKFHGCAVRASFDPDRYGAAFVATRPQITAWNTKAETRLILERMVTLATTKPTLMIGLSAQDENIQRLFAQAKDRMMWAGSTEPPAHVFAENRLGHDHRNLLRVVYGDDYDANPDDIEAKALVRAYGKPLLTALVVFVLADKLAAYLDEVDAPALGATERQHLSGGLMVLAKRLAQAAEPDRLQFIEALIASQTRALSLFQEGLEPAPGPPLYKPLGSQRANLVANDPALATNGIRELSVALALLGRGEAAGRWAITTGPALSGAEGALALAHGGSQVAVFFAANGRAAVRLEAEGSVDPDAADVVVINSTEPVRSAKRSPRGQYGRTGAPGAGEVNMYDLLGGSSNLDALEEGFRQAVAL